MHPAKPLLITILILTALAIPSSTRADSCTPSFPYDRGWLGADAAYSIPLDNDRTLWLFGDTFCAPLIAPKPGPRAGSSMIANSIAISSCRAGPRMDHRLSLGHVFAGIATSPARVLRQPHSGVSAIGPSTDSSTTEPSYVALLRVRSHPRPRPLRIQTPRRRPRDDHQPRRRSAQLVDHLPWPSSRSRTSFPGGSIVVRAPLTYTC